MDQPQIVKVKRGVNLVLGNYRYKKVVHQVEHNHMADKEKAATLQTKARLCELAVL